MCKKPTCDASQKDSKRHNCVTSFWLVENYFHFSYPKCGRVVTGSKIGKFGEEDEKCYIQKCKQCVSYLWLIWNPPAYNTSHDSSVTHLRPIGNNVWPICNPTHELYLIHLLSVLWPTCHSNVIHLRLTCDPPRDSSITYPVIHTWPTQMWSTWDSHVTHPVTHL